MDTKGQYGASSPTAGLADTRGGRFSLTGSARFARVSSGVDSRAGLGRVAAGSCLLPIAAGSAQRSLLDSGSRHGIASSACPCQRDRRLADAREGTGSIIVDGTVGGGGHTVALARRLGAGGRLIGLDRDPAMLALAEKAVKAAGARRCR